MIQKYALFAAALMIGALATESLGAGVVFRDDFSDSSLQAGWTIVRPDTATYSLTATPGYFRVLTTRGLLGEEGTARNLLVRPASGDFILDSRLEFDPRDGQPFAGLLIYQDDAHAVALGLVYASGERGQFRGVVLLNVGDDIDLTNRPASKYDETNSPNPGVIYLRLLRHGDRYIGAYSADGISYREMGTVTNELNESLNVGVGAANGDSVACGPACDVPIAALFDYFQITDLDDNGGEPPVQGILESVDIEGPEEVVSGGSGTFRAIARFGGGDSNDVSDLAEWVVAPAEAGTIAEGEFRAATSNIERMATIVATYTQAADSGPITRTKAVLVSIRPAASPGTGRLCGVGVIGLLPLSILSLVWRKNGRGQHDLTFGAWLLQKRRGESANKRGFRMRSQSGFMGRFY